MKVTIRVNPIECISAANCVGIAPNFFRIGDEPFVELLDRKGDVHGTEIDLDVTEAELEKLRDAVDSCPTRAIELVEEGP